MSVNINIRPPAFFGMRLYRTERCIRYGVGEGWATFKLRNSIDDWVCIPDDFPEGYACVCPQDILLVGEEDCPPDPKHPPSQPKDWDVGDEFYLLENNWYWYKVFDKDELQVTIGSTIKLTCPYNLNIEVPWADRILWIYKSNKEAKPAVKYNSKCNVCSSNAFLLFASYECSNPKCRNYK